MREFWVPDLYRPWTADEPLSELTLYRDWDWVASMITSLRTYLFDHGTIPTWNYLICGGRPELSIPSSWAYTWPSLFGYALPANHAIIAVWLLMSFVGFFSMRALLTQWTGRHLAATLGASLFVFNGYFAARFNPGHVSYAFFHLVPVMMLLYEHDFARSLQGKQSRLRLLLTTFVALCFFTAGLPHALMYLYPAFLLLVLARVAGTARTRGWSSSLKVATPPVVAHLLGLWLATYKLWPVVRWQLGFPRTGVRFESNDPTAVLSNTLDFIPDFLDFVWLQPDSWPPWEYAAFVGPLPWLLALIAAFVPLTRSWRARDSPVGQGQLGPGFALLLIAFGFNLSLGNGNPWSMARVFSSLPLLEGIRVFPRYQILVILGLSILSAQGFAVLLRISGSSLTRRAVVAVVGISACAPAMLQTISLVWNIQASPHSEIVQAYPAPQPLTTQIVGLMSTRGPMGGHTVALMERGYWIANCEEDLKSPVPKLRVARGEAAALSDAAPVGVRELTHNSLKLAYGTGLGEWVTLKLPFLPTFDSSAVPDRVRHGRATFSGRDLEQSELTITARYPGPEEGAWSALIGLAATVAFFWLRPGWSRSNPPPPVQPGPS